VRSGAEELRNAFAEHGLTADEFSGTRYLRVRRVQQLQRDERLDGDLRRMPVTQTR
jgi:hypothetical protein